MLWWSNVFLSPHWSVGTVRRVRSRHPDRWTSHLLQQLSNLLPAPPLAIIHGVEPSATLVDDLPQTGLLLLQIILWRVRHMLTAERLV